jgi:hypothetical protein
VAALTPDKINAKTFGPVFTFAVMGQIYAQPLIATHGPEAHSSVDGRRRRNARMLSSLGVPLRIEAVTHLGPFEILAVRGGAPDQVRMPEGAGDRPRSFGEIWSAALSG